MIVLKVAKSSIMILVLEGCYFVTSYHGRRQYVNENDHAQEMEPASLYQTLSPVLMALIHSRPQSSHDLITS